MSVAHNKTTTASGVTEEFYRTRTKLDIEGNTLAIFDAKQHSKTAGSNALNPSGTYASPEAEEAYAGGEKPSEVSTISERIGKRPTHAIGTSAQSSYGC